MYCVCMYFMTMYSAVALLNSHTTPFDYALLNSHTTPFDYALLNSHTTPFNYSLPY